MLADGLAQTDNVSNAGRALGQLTEKIAPGGPYYFAKHVFWCIESRYAVLLDLKRDKYLCIPRVRLDACGGLLSGWPAPQREARAGSSTPDNEIEKMLRPMLEQGLLTTRASERNPAVSTGQPVPTMSLAPIAGHTSRGRYRLLHLYNFVAATTLASSLLRWRRLENVVNTVARRRTRYKGTQDTAGLDALHELVAVFQSLRPIFPRPYQCLYDSLALLEFLSRYQQSPRWVFGVRMDPFNAHCWVQTGDVVLNDTVDEVRSYTPIMVV